MQPFWHRKYTHFAGTSTELEPWEIEEEIDSGLDSIFEELPPQPRIIGATLIAAELRWYDGECYAISTESLGGDPGHIRPEEQHTIG